jgi:hypothetical protein
VKYNMALKGNWPRNKIVCGLDKTTPNRLYDDIASSTINDKYYIATCHYKYYIATVYDTRLMSNAKLCSLANLIKMYYN